MKRNRLTLIFLIIGYIFIFFFSFTIGQYPISFADSIKVLFSRILPIKRVWDEIFDVVIFQARFPRIIAAMLVGGALSIGGASFQGIFYNPLVEPYILGVSSGAGFGAALAILLGANMFWIQITAFTMGLLSMVLTLWIGSSRRSKSQITLVLSGFIVGSLFTSFISFIKFVADPYTKLPSIVFWLMGSFASVTYKALAISAPVIVIGSMLLILLRWKLNILAMGDSEAKTLGENPGRLRLSVIFITTIIVASSVSLSGIIGWVGLVVPHIARMLFGSDHRKLIPVSLLLGSGYLLLIDDLSRTITTSELPIGVLTALIGAPVFVFLLRKERTGWM
jgi:iron complex transport system permease protein